MTKSKFSMRLPRFTILNGIYSVLEDWSRANPVRSHWRIWWNPEPGAAIGHAGTTYPLTPDRAMVVPPYVPISHHLERPVRSLALHLEVEEPETSPQDTVFHVALPRDLIQRLSLIPEHSAHGLGFGGGAVDPALSLLVGEVIHRIFQLLPSSIWETSRIDARIEEAASAMRGALESGCSNEQLAKRARLSTNAFVRLFKREVGISPQAYLLNARLDHAAGLLLRSDESLEQIAAACGFCDRNYMSKQFKRRFLVGPATYRRKGLV